MIRHKAVAMYRNDEVITKFKKRVDAQTMDKIQKPITVIPVLLKVTTCLYLSPSHKAKSLSTLIAVTVNKDTKQKKRLEKPDARIA